MSCFQGVKKLLIMKSRKKRQNNKTKKGQESGGEAAQDEDIPPKAKYTSPIRIQSDFDLGSIIH